MPAGSFSFLLSTELLDEYRRVLLRGPLRKLHGLSRMQVDVVLTEIAANAVVRAPDPGQSVEAPYRGNHQL